MLSKMPNTSQLFAKFMTDLIKAELEGQKRFTDPKMEPIKCDLKNANQSWDWRHIKRSKFSLMIAQGDACSIKQMMLYQHQSYLAFWMGLEIVINFYNNLVKLLAFTSQYNCINNYTKSLWLGFYNNLVEFYWGLMKLFYHLYRWTFRKESSYNIKTI